MSLGPGGKILLVLLGLGIIAFSLQHYGLLPQLRPYYLALKGKAAPGPRPLAMGDFPPGSIAPVADLTALPARPVRLGITPRAGVASALWLAGGVGHHREAPASKSYAVEVELVSFAGPEGLRDALLWGGERGGVDAALISVDELAMRWPSYHDAAPRVVSLVARSQGSVALAAGPAVPSPEALRGKTIAAPGRGPERYFELFTLARAGLGARDVKLLAVADPGEAAKALREGRADAAVGLTPEVALAAKDRAGKVLATTADAPHLVELVLVVRGDHLARYPESVRRLVRGLSDAGEAVRKDAVEAARLLDAAAPALGDPVQAIKDEPPASLAENLGFFGVAGDAPVHFDELFTSAANLGLKLGELPAAIDPGELRELMPLRALAASKEASAAK